MPAFIVGLATVYVPNVTGVGVHTLPSIIGGVVIARRGLPGRPAIAAAAGYLGLMAASYLFAPVAETSTTHAPSSRRWRASFPACPVGSFT